MSIIKSNQYFTSKEKKVKVSIKFCEKMEYKNMLGKTKPNKLCNCVLVTCVQIQTMLRMFLMINWEGRSISVPVVM
jgi:hypothetical protein